MTQPGLQKSDQMVHEALESGISRARLAEELALLSVSHKNGGLAIELVDQALRFTAADPG